jgi:hypothetical protein
MHYTDFTVRARDWQEGSFKVEVTQSPMDRMRQPESSGYPAALARPLRSLERKRVRADQLQSLGRHLADMLLPPAVRAMLTTSLAATGPGQGLRLRLVLDDLRVANLPWEYLYLPGVQRGDGLDGFLALDPRLSLVRHEAIPMLAGSVAARWPLKLVVGFSAPKDTPQLDLNAERTVIEEALAGVHGVEVVWVEHLTVPRLEAACQGAHLFHFAGHGGFIWEDNQQQGAGVLYLEEPDGQPLPFPVDHLALTLRAAGVRVVVLGGCDTGRRDGVNAWSGVAPALMRVGIPATVAMQYAVYDDAAVAFARRFYQALAAGLTLDEAMLAGRLAILNLRQPGELDWGVPVLYMRSADGMVFPEMAADPALEALRQKQRVTVRQRASELHDEMTGLQVNQAPDAGVEVDQEIEQLAPGGAAVGARIERLAGGRIQTEQRVRVIGQGGRLLGVRIGSRE